MFHIKTVQRLISLAERRLPSAVATVTTYVPGARVSTSIVAVVPSMAALAAVSEPMSEYTCTAVISVPASIVAVLKALGRMATFAVVLPAAVGASMPRCPVEAGSGLSHVSGRNVVSGIGHRVATFKCQLHGKIPRHIVSTTSSAGCPTR